MLLCIRLRHLACALLRIETSQGNLTIQERRWLSMPTQVLRPRIVSEGSSLCRPAREQARRLFYLCPHQA
jgi:hypothetical protein